MEPGNGPSPLTQAPGASAPEGTGTTVLVTGGSGYLAGWIISDLLERGYHVRTTVRDLARGPLVRSMIGPKAADRERLSFVRADLRENEGWDAAAADTDYVLHVASPMPVGEYRGTDLIGPAVEGTLRVLRAARDAGVRRVVLTSSGDAAVSQGKSDTVFDETTWNEAPDTPAHAYSRSKTLAERAAWSFAQSNGLELATVLPAFMQGPVLGNDYSGSIEVLARMLTGSLPAIPHLGWNIVDVRDVADLHVRAMTLPQAAGERFIGAGEFLWLADVARLLRNHLGEKAKKVPRRMLPNAVVRVGALFNDDMKQMVPRLSLRQDVSSAKAKRLLQWRPRPAITALLDGANSLIDQNLVQVD